MNSFNIESYKDIESSKIEWLWFPYIPYGKITLLQGDPGDGKTSFILYLASILSSGRANEVFGLTKERINIIYQTAEDDKSDTIKPKLIAYGADTSKIYFIKDEEKLTLGSELIENSIKETNARLLILDPLQAFIGDNSMYTAGDLRPIFKKLAEVAKRNNCAIVIIGHMNKQKGGKEIYRSLGSVDIVAIARSVLYLKRADDNSNYRILYQIKNNLYSLGNPISFEFKNENKIKYIGIVMNDENINKSSKKDEMANIMIGLLSDAEVKSTIVYDKGKEKGISPRTINDAKKALGVKTIKKKDGWYWTLQGEIHNEK